MSSLKNIALEQDRDQWIVEIKNYKKDKILPNDDKRSREILTTSEQYFCDNANILYRIYKPNPKTTPQILYEQIVLPESMIAEVFRHAHDLPYSGGHAEIKKTYLRLVPYVFFKNMYTRTENYVQSCTVCAQRKSPRRKPTAHLVPPSLTEKMPFACVQIDFMGPITPSFGTS